MSTATKTKIQPTWAPAKIQEETAGIMARTMATTMKTLEKVNPALITEWQHAMATTKFEHIKHMGAKTPIELVKMLAEYETNVFGSKINVWGDDKEAHLEYELCGCFNAMQKLMQPSEQQMKEMGQKCAANTDKVVHELFGMHAEYKFGTGKANEPCLTICFKK